MTTLNWAFVGEMFFYKIVPFWGAVERRDFEIEIRKFLFNF